MGAVHVHASGASAAPAGWGNGQSEAVFGLKRWKGT